MRGCTWSVGAVRCVTVLVDRVIVLEIESVSCAWF